jgi:tetratricopeptide (TPR) repeat protein
MLYLNQNQKQANAQSSHDWQRPLLAADGYLYLGMPAHALKELESIDESAQRCSPVLRARVRVLLHLKRWDEANALSEAGNSLYPDENEFTVQRAFALHRMKKGDDAVQVLLSAPEWIRRTGILHYNLACYEAQLGDLPTARQCIQAAIEINSSFKKNARTDPDLARLWN